ncbi:E3 ubiquitin-protein ligase listerin [Panicum miliaceum]|uniref:E3 ubiquitin-protein ligase listerin n=1 Tax=Panicum miliaceum TaxID=4540 RepID=A0A3L6T0M5_PANMI|nr:E3 ubiquitin-protein ligase listerin [Panicum miliaceum]
MGKQKARASSSGMAASLVPHAQGAVPTVGFGGYHGAVRVEPAAPSDPDAPIRLTPDVDGEVLQNLKRLGRKDPTTKLKALSALSTLFAQAPGEEVVQIGPQWAFEYKRLLLDYNREVRCATHEAMSSLVTAIKKGIAPHLKSLMGPWWFSQFDPAPEVAQAARRSFEVISSSLLAMATLIDILLGVKLQNCDVDSTSTEKRSLSKVRSTTRSSVEAAFCINVSLMCSSQKVLLYETMKKLSPTILGAFHEKDASCHPSMWDTILVFSRKFPEAWSYCNIHKVVLSRFWNFLQNGCYGSKQISYPHLVQFLDSIPSKPIIGQQFVFDFLHNLWAGRNQRQLSAADSLAFCIAFKHNFLWLLENVSRYSGEDSSDDTPIKLITDILAKIVWRDYLLLSSDTAGSGIQLSHKNSGILQALVKLLSVLVEIFGPIPLFLKNYQNYHGKSDVKSYLELFNADLLPWCFNGKYSTCNSKIDLLLSLFQDECFFDQWCSIIKYTRAEQKHSIDDKTSNIKNRLELLTLLLQKVRERIAGGKLRNLKKNAYLPEHWRHDLLDSTATSVLCDLTAANRHVSFLCAALGGSDQEDQICFLSAETVHKVLGFIVKDLASALLASTFEWARLAYSLLLPSEPEHLKHPEENSLPINFQTAQFAFKVLQGSFFSLGRLEEDSVFPSILAALFVIEWECSMSLAVDDESDLEGHIQDMDVGSSMGRSSKDYLDEKMHLKANLAESIHAFCQSLSPSFWSNLPSCTLNRLANILAQSVRYSVFETRDLHVEKTAVLCSEWVVEMLKLICLDDINLQSFFDLLLSEGEYWPLWLRPCLQNGHASVKVQLELAIADDIELKHERFVAFVDRLILNLGFDFRAWVAGEILCTWTWKGGSALKTFLPSLVQYMKEESRLEVSIVSLLLDTLLGGTLMHESGPWVLFNAWHISDNEIGKIQDRFLRALVALLFTTNTKNCLWGESDALVFFEQLLSNLFMGSTVNRKCLKVLPFVMSTIIKPLPQKLNEDSPYGDLVRKSILSWLEAAISCLSSSPREVPVQDFEDWMQVALSCFPFSITGEAQRLVVSVEREISDAEISLMLTLFQKYQFFYNGAASSLSTSETVIPRTVELLGVKLTAVMVGYCWTKLQENDWHFVFHMVFKCIESSALLVEEMTDGINDAVINQVSSEDALEKLKLMVSTTDKLTLSLAESSLVTLYHLNHLGNLQEVETAKSLQLIRSGDYAESTNKMMESILRLFLVTGVSEAIAKSFGEEASSIIASFIKNASPEIRRSALESMELWGLTKGSVSGLYSILFSSQPIFHLQFAAFSLLLSEPFCQLSLLKDSSLGENRSSAQRSDICQSAELMPDSEKTPCLRDELSALVEFPTSELLKTDLTARDRVDVFIAWALLSHPQSLPSSSIIRENVLQYIQEKHIPVKSAAPSGKKKDAELLPEAEAAAKASKNAIVTCSLLPYVESLLPVGTLQMSSLAGSLYGMMIRLLPSFVRTWFTTLRDRSLSYSIESFTRQWCSPPLLLDEFPQVKDSVYADENFSVSVNRLAYEIVATYKKEETGIDLVIRLPNCYPLRHVDVECTRSLGISEVKCRKWLLSLTSFVRNQNGAIAEAIRTWKSNFDKEFEGVEECPICYSILHTSNHSLPRLACKTCRHKFHGACLYKWFSTSNKSTCPLCQTPF